MDDARHLLALRGVASVLVGSPHRAPCADLAQRGGAPDVPGGQPCFYEIFTRLKSQTGQTAEVLAATFLGVTPAGAPSPRDRLSNPARVASSSLRKNPRQNESSLIQFFNHESV